MQWGWQHCAGDCACATQQASLLQLQPSPGGGSSSPLQFKELRMGPATHQRRTSTPSPLGKTPQRPCTCCAAGASATRVAGLRGPEAGAGSASLRHSMHSVRTKLDANVPAVVQSPQFLMATGGKRAHRSPGSTITDKAYSTTLIDWGRMGIIVSPALLCQQWVRRRRIARGWLLPERRLGWHPRLCCCFSITPSARGLPEGPFTPSTTALPGWLPAGRNCWQGAVAHTGP